MQTPDTIDRVAPTLTPDEPVVMYQNWHHLLFLHWEVPPDEVQALLPPGLDLDTFEGHAYVGLVPFTVTGMRPVMTPAVPGISSFHEVNVRTYVHRNGRDPGVWFFSLDASSSVAVAAARAAYKLAYFHSKIDFSASNGPRPLISFRSERTDPNGMKPATSEVVYQPADMPPSAAVPGTLDHFFIERYILYSVDSEHDLHLARIHHQPYPVQRAIVTRLDETLVWAAGIRRPERPHLSHYAREVNVNVYPLHKLT